MLMMEKPQQHKTKTANVPSRHRDKQRMPIEENATYCYIPRTAKSSQIIAGAKRN
jgi:hypothetical protein